MVALISVSPDGIDLGSKSVTFISEPDTDFGVGKRHRFPCHLSLNLTPISVSENDPISVSSGGVASWGRIQCRLVAAKVVPEKRTINSDT
jgi:hypothetical protein